MSTKPIIAGPSPAASRYLSVFEAHFADIWRFARRRCASSHDADDVAAETFAVAWRKRDEVPTDEVRLWLFGVARRVLANHRRWLERQDAIRVRLSETMPQEVPQEISTAAPPESQGAVWEALGALSEDDRDLLIMQAWDGLSVGEMAIVLGCSANAVSLRLFKVRRKLTRELQRKENPRSGHVAGGSLSTEGGRS